MEIIHYRLTDKELDEVLEEIAKENLKNKKELCGNTTQKER